MVLINYEGQQSFVKLTLWVPSSLKLTVSSNRTLNSGHSSSGDSKFLSKVFLDPFILGSGSGTARLLYVHTYTKKWSFFVPMVYQDNWMKAVQEALGLVTNKGSYKWDLKNVTHLLRLLFLR